jgi:hypothetical protein
MASFKLSMHISLLYSTVMQLFIFVPIRINGQSILADNGRYMIQVKYRHSVMSTPILGRWFVANFYFLPFFYTAFPMVPLHLAGFTTWVFLDDSNA